MDPEMDDDGRMTMSQVAMAAPIDRSEYAKHIKCAVHGLMRFDPTCVAIMDTPEFQRLRKLKQLGLTDYVYPSATHTRFAHSLGCCHLSNEFIDKIYRMQRAELDMDLSDVSCVTIAGLCHDLGHGPFSHVFDKEILRRKGITDWKHENMSCEILDNIVDRLPDNLAIEKSDLHRIKAMIDPKGHKDFIANDSKRFLYDIVSNDRNGIDVDKFDYLARDSKFCDVPIGFNFRVPMQINKVLDNKICFLQRDYHQLWEMFNSRQSLHRAVYTHRKVKIIEFMVVDALMEVDKIFHFEDRLWDAKRFVRLNDDLLTMIEDYDEFHLGGMEEDQGRALAAAQAIIRRIRDRELYRFVNEVKVPKHMVKAMLDGEALPSPADIVSYYSGSDVQLCHEDVIVSLNKIDFSMDDANPLDSVGFFHNVNTARHARPIDREDASHFMTNTFQELSVRIYSRNPDNKVCEALEQALMRWRDKQLPGANLATPCKGVREEAEEDGPSGWQGPTGAGGAEPAEAQPSAKRQRTFDAQLDMAHAEL